MSQITTADVANGLRDRNARERSEEIKAQAAVELRDNIKRVVLRNPKTNPAKLMLLKANPTYGADIYNLASTLFTPGQFKGMMRAMPKISKLASRVVSSEEVNDFVHYLQEGMGGEIYSQAIAGIQSKSSMVDENNEAARQMIYDDVARVADEAAGYVPPADAKSDAAYSSTAAGEAAFRSTEADAQANEALEALEGKEAGEKNEVPLVDLRASQQPHEMSVDDWKKKWGSAGALQPSQIIERNKEYNLAKRNDELRRQYEKEQMAVRHKETLVEMKRQQEESMAEIMKIREQEFADRMRIQTEMLESSHKTAMEASEERRQLEEEQRHLDEMKQAEYDLAELARNNQLKIEAAEQAEAEKIYAASHLHLSDVKNKVRRQAEEVLHRMYEDPEGAKAELARIIGRYGKAPSYMHAYAKVSDISPAEKELLDQRGELVSELVAENNNYLSLLQRSKEAANMNIKRDLQIEALRAAETTRGIMRSIDTLDIQLNKLMSERSLVGFRRSIEPKPMFEHEGLQIELKPLRGEPPIGAVSVEEPAPLRREVSEYVEPERKSEEKHVLGVPQMSPAAAAAAAQLSEPDEGKQVVDNRVRNEGGRFATEPGRKSQAEKLRDLGVVRWNITEPFPEEKMIGIRDARRRVFPYDPAGRKMEELENKELANIAQNIGLGKQGTNKTLDKMLKGDKESRTTVIKLLREHFQKLESDFKGTKHYSGMGMVRPSSHEDRVHRIHLAIGEKKAGNDSPHLGKQACIDIVELYDGGHVDHAEVKKIHKFFGRPLN